MDFCQFRCICARIPPVKFACVGHLQKFPQLILANIVWDRCLFKISRLKSPLNAIKFGTNFGMDAAEASVSVLKWVSFQKDDDKN